MRIDPESFRIPTDSRVRLKDWPTVSKPVYTSEKDYQRQLLSSVSELSALQTLLYASDSHSLLLVFQAMDSAGKDGAISHLLTGVNPQGCEVFSFRHPTPAELEHDFLWRTTRCLPARGRIGVFNRSYYEEVLIVRVHPEIFRGERIPDKTKSGESVWTGRFRSIVELERHLHQSGTRVIKIFLHLSKEEQRKRFLERIDDPEKQWKLSQADLDERRFWKQYRVAYEECLGATSTEDSPWYVVPADDKLSSRLVVSRIVVDTLKSLNLSYPKATRERRHELRRIRKQLVKAAPRRPG